MGSRDIPQADMFKVQKGANAQRRELSKFIPQIGLNCINYREIGEMDYFYMDTQKYRDFYRDAYNMMHKPLRFHGCLGSGGYSKDHAFEAITAPLQWVLEPQPVVFSVEYPRTLNLDGAIRIGAHFSARSVSNFKR